MADGFESIEGIDDNVALSVTVRAEYLDGVSEALDVDVVIHEAVDVAWAVSMLRRIAEDLEAGQLTTEDDRD